jgi:hypothetical protein
VLGSYVDGYVKVDGRSQVTGGGPYVETRLHRRAFDGHGNPETEELQGPLVPKLFAPERRLGHRLLVVFSAIELMTIMFRKRSPNIEVVRYAQGLSPISVA